MRVHLTLRSENQKTGPIPVSTSSSDTCPPTCGLFTSCYAKSGPLFYHWRQVDSGGRGDDWLGFCNKIDALPEGQLWRHNQAGDLPGDGVDIDPWMLGELIVANEGKRGFTYTHYPLNHGNLSLLRQANKMGFTINVSCETPEQVAQAKRWGLPTVMVLPSDTKWRRRGDVLVCPAYWSDIDCARCGICQSAKPSRVTVGFPAHGAKKKVVDIQLRRK